jgi:hypothetical protein
MGTFANLFQLILVISHADNPIPAQAMPVRIMQHTMMRSRSLLARETIPSNMALSESMMHMISTGVITYVSNVDSII